MTFAASIPCGYKTIRSQLSTASWLDVVGSSLEPPPVEPRYSRLTSSVLTPAGISRCNGVHVGEVAPPGDRFSAG